MSRTLNLHDVLLTNGRNLFLMGRFTEALAPLTKLSGFRKLPDHINEELQTLLGELYLQKKEYKQSRRHLTAAIALRPNKAEYCYLMAVAIDEDEQADRIRAEMYYARAVQLEPNETTYLVDFGTYLFSIGKNKNALSLLRKAYTLGTSDPEVVGKVAEVLRREGHPEEATTKVRAALFHSHGAASFRQLWQQHQFALIHATQQAKKRTPPTRLVILPFVSAPQHGKYVELGEKTFRIDQAEPLDSPKKKEPQPFRRPPKKG